MIKAYLQTLAEKYATSPDHFYLIRDFVEVIEAAMDDDSPESFVSAAFSVRGHIPGELPKHTLMGIVKATLRHADRDDLWDKIRASLELIK